MNGLDKYLNKRAVRGPWRIEGFADPEPDQIVVIPCLGERENILSTLVSLTRNAPEAIARTLVLCVVNNGAGGPSAAHRENNRATLELLDSLIRKNATHSCIRPSEHSTAKSVCDSNLRIAFIDASSEGLGIPESLAGVGMARKIGLDLGLRLFRPTMLGRSILIFLDGDTLAAPDYLSAIRGHFDGQPSGAATVPFVHPIPESRPLAEAITLYELHLRCYVLGLRLSGSPYAFHTVGSAMACRAETYIRAGGMNTRTSTEDFYFLQNAAKVAPIGQVAGTAVYPAARASVRVPYLGTGWTMSQYLAGDRSCGWTYAPEVYEALARWIRAMIQSVEAGPASAMNEARNIHPAIERHLASLDFPRVWERLKKNAANPARFERQLHVWFDGLRTLRFIHVLTEEAFPRLPVVEVAARLLEESGIQPPPRGTGDRLQPAGLLDDFRRVEYGLDSPPGQPHTSFGNFQNEC